jgi:hypothetical protein
LLANIQPIDATNTKINWKVTNLTGMASINSEGLLTAEKNGEINVSAKATDGSNISGELIINISNQIVLVENLIITDNLKNDTIIGIGTKLNLKVSVSPSDATNQNVDWIVENITGKASISSNGLLTTLSHGSIIIIAKAKDESKVQSKKEYKIVFPVGFQEHINSQNFKIFPNPTKGKIQIQIDQIPSEGVIIEIRNSLGQLLMKKRVFENLSEWSLAQCQNSLYFVTIIDKKSISTQKVANALIPK